MASDLLWTMRGLVVLSTLILILIPARATYKALRTKSVTHMAIFPLAAGFASSHMWYTSLQRRWMEQWLHRR